MKTLYLIFLLFYSVGCASADLPFSTGTEPRVRYVDYHADAVTSVRVQRGTATRIVLAEDERISRDGAATGFSADCRKADDEWCMRADAGMNYMLVRPKSGARFNNLELRTDKRDYSFRFDVIDDSAQRKQQNKVMPANDQATYRVVFRYAAVPKAVPASQGAPSVRTVAEVVNAARPHPRNWRYSMQPLPGSDDIVPSLVFDDGRFTYFRFPANREVPTIYFVSPAGEEGRVNFHVDQHDSGLIVVERMGLQFILRLGGAVIGIWNDAFDPDAEGPVDGTTIDGLKRVMR
ncbi:TrbG/VirB9 family P-type conjugative transfer protein [Duganella sp. BuS-21]|uniref:TrbG/VirB9 family P-type conjugative transfer protein n=1 Tax=Duganella sp. BuS-21 TaxID=2943848 RepID=UPI0035A693F1